MRALVWHGKEDVRVDTVDDPRIEETTDAIIRVTSTAICGSDLHLYGGKVIKLQEGDILGHEPMGIVEEVGKDASSHLSVGDRVVIPFNISCGRCFYCDQHLYSQCETTASKEHGKGAALFGYTHLYGGVPGGQAEYLRVPQAHFGPIKVPEGPSDDRFLFLSDVLPTAWQGVVYADVPEGGTLAVYGLGPIGQMACRIALRAKGAGRVIGIDPVPERRAMAERYGVETIDPAEVDDPPSEILRRTGRGADAAIDAVGMESDASWLGKLAQAAKIQIDRTEALRQTMGSVRRGGTVSLSGVYIGLEQMFPLGDLFDKQLQLRMGQANVKRWVPEILPFLEGDDDPLGTEDLTTHRIPLGQAPEGYASFQQKDDGAIKVVLDPSAG